MIELYQQIVNLRSSRKSQERGYMFEQLIREIQPWEFKPPVVISPKSEQLDGVYTRNGITFIIESKAKLKKISQGDHDWEDFEVKIRRRHGHGVIGIFCSLYNVNNNIYEAGDRLNNEGIFNIIIAGDTWDELLEHQLDFGNLIDFMVQHVRSKNSSKPPKIQTIFSWFYDKNDVWKRMLALCQKESGLFLRRYRHKHHEHLYVKRSIDNSIKEQINQLRPSFLNEKKVGQKEIPKQFLIIRDLSGTGKTTTAVELALVKEDYLVIGFTANQVPIDLKIDSFFNNYKNYCLNELKTINSPIIFIVDSLDEISNVREKKRELKSVFEKISDLNSYAQSLRYLCFPILIIYTIRDDYYREWEADFEGRHEISEKRKFITYYNDEEFSKAIIKYSEIYKYSIINSLSKDSKEILSIPINLEIFSDANEFEGEVYVNEIWEGKILQSYFQRKIDDINKHLQNAISKEICLNVLANLSFHLAESKDSSFTKGDFTKMIYKNFLSINLDYDTLLHLFISEQILVVNIVNKEVYSFRYLRFIEYLVAYLAVTNILIDNINIKWLDKFTQTVFDSNFLSMYKVFENIKHITRTSYPELQSEIENHFHKSEIFMSKKLPIIRGNIAIGERTSKEDLKMIFDNTFSNNSQLTWDAFFVIAAKRNKLPGKIIIDTFSLAWSTNNNNPNRWKLLTGIAKNQLLFNDQVIKAIINTTDYKVWEVYIGYIIENKLVSFFNENEISDIIGKKLVELVANFSGEWNYLLQLYNGLRLNHKYIPGNANFQESDFSRKNSGKSQIEISEEKKLECNKIIEELYSVYFKKIRHANFVPSITSLWGNELSFFNQQFNNKFNRPYGKEKKSFFNYLIANHENYTNLISFLIDNPTINCNILGNDINKVSLFQEIYRSSYHNKHILFEYLVQRKYPRKKIDDDFLKDEINTNPYNEWIYLSQFYLIASDLRIAKKISSCERIICTLLSFKYNRVIGFRFPNIIQVANNALSHYFQYYHIIIKAIKHYNLYDSLSAKPSFLRKENEIILKPAVFDRSSDDMFSEFFPELFTTQKSKN